MLAVLALFGLCFLLCYPVTVRLDYQNGVWRVAWLPRVCGGYAKAKAVPLKRREPQDADRKSKWWKRGSWADDKDLLIFALRRLSLDQFRLEMRLDTGDPFSANLLAGSLLAAIGSLRGVAAAALRRLPARPQIRVRPAWQGGGIQSRLRCIFRLHLGDIIAIIFYALWLIGKGRLANGKRA